eukprot:311402-Prorocentrum_minimum.AAC.1
MGIRAREGASSFRRGGGKIISAFGGVSPDSNPLAPHISPWAGVRTVWPDVRVRRTAARQRLDVRPECAKVEQNCAETMLLTDVVVSRLLVNKTTRLVDIDSSPRGCRGRAAARCALSRHDRRLC